MIKTVSKEELAKTIIKTVGTHALDIEDLNTIAELVSYGIRKQVNWRKIYDHYDPNLRRASVNINEFLKVLNFKENLMVGIVPK